MLPKNPRFRPIVCGVALSLAATLGFTNPLPAQDYAKFIPVTDPNINSPKEDLRQSLFKEAAKPACLAVKAHPNGGTSIESSLDGFLKQAITALKAKSDKDLQPLFHKRLNTSLGAIAQIHAKLEQVYGAPFDISLYRLWALNTVDGSPAGLDCDEGVTIFPLYGYPLEFGVWLQVMGQNEVGRIYMTLVPADGRWNIGAFHMQQWTHASKEPSAWVQEALDASRKGHKEAAYIKLDLAAKLLDSGRFLTLSDHADVVKARDALMTREEWEKAVKTALPDYEIGFLETVLVLDGAGILVRIRIPAEISLEDIKKTCANMLQSVAQKSWASALGGVRCSFNLPKEPMQRDGVLGGIYMNFSEAKDYAAKANSKG